jgi:hypothetical protein
MGVLEVPCSNISSGIYFVKVAYKNTTETIKIVKE